MVVGQRGQFERVSEGTEHLRKCAPDKELEYHPQLAEWRSYLGATRFLRQCSLVILRSRSVDQTHDSIPLVPLPHSTLASLCALSSLDETHRF